MAYGDFEDLSRKLSVDKILHNKTFNIAKNSKYDGYQGGLVSVVYIFLIKRLLMEQLKMKIYLIKN